MPRDVYENFQVQRALEMFVAWFCRKNAESEKIQEIILINDSMRSLLENGAYEEFIQPYLKLDRKFRYQIISIFQ